MEAHAVPREAAAGTLAALGALAAPPPRMLRVASDQRLVALVRAGHEAAFEAVYARHHRGILSFCRHLLGDPEDAADAMQHTFLAAYNDLISSEKEINLRAWLYTIARNRCYSVLRARRERPTGEPIEAITEGLAAQVQRREDLRQLLVDMQRLPDDQRAALVLAELATLSHQEIGSVLGVPPAKIKALVFQARASLIASRAARDTDCSVIREQLSSVRGSALRRRNLRRHLHQCAGCREFSQEVQRQRLNLAVILPVVPAIALRESVAGGASGGGGAAATGSGAAASSVLKGLALKGLVGGLITALAGSYVASHLHSAPVGSSRQPVPAAHNRGSAPRGGGGTAAAPALAVGPATAADRASFAATGARPFFWRSSWGTWWASGAWSSPAPAAERRRGAPQPASGAAAEPGMTPGLAPPEPGLTPLATITAPPPPSAPAPPAAPSPPAATAPPAAPSPPAAPPPPGAPASGAPSNPPPSPQSQTMPRMPPQPATPSPPPAQSAPGGSMPPSAAASGRVPSP